MNNLGSVLLLAVVSLCAQVGAVEALYIVQNGRPEATIVHEALEGKPWLARWAVSALQKHIREISGARLKAVQDGKSGVTGPAIHVGRTTFVRDQNLGLDGLDRDGFIVKRVGQSIVLAGRDSAFGNLQAVRIFLEDVCGFRWFMPGPLGKVIPKARDIAVHELDKTVEPDFVSRFLSGLEVIGGPDDADTWYRWMGMHRRYPAIHAIGKVVHPKKYGKDHPRYFPLIAGKRVIPTWSKVLHNWQPCWSNPEVQQLAVDAARKHFQDHPDAECFSLAQNDNWGWCQCEKCTEMNGGIKYDSHSHRNYSPVHYAFLNRVCKELEREYPDRKISAYAYQCGTIEPPPFKLHRNIVVNMVNDHSHWHFDERFRTQELAFIKSWAEVASTLGFHEHHFDNGTYAPWLALRSTAEVLRTCNRLGVRAYHGEEYPHWGLTTPKTYITARLLWNVNEEVEALLQDYCQKFFGAAAAPMRRHYDRLEEAWNAQPLAVGAQRIRHVAKGRESLKLYSPAVMEELFGYLHDALALAKADIVKKRIAHVVKSLRLTDYYVQREDIYTRIDPRDGLTPYTFAELVGNVNAMHHLTLSIRRYMQEHILDDPLTFHAGLWPKRNKKWSRPQYINMEAYYCEIGAGVAGFLAREVQALARDLSQEELSKALHARFEALAKYMIEPDPDFRGERGAAWEELSTRVRDYLNGTAMVKRLAGPPAEDGKLGEAEWQGAPVLRVLHPCVRATKKEVLAKYPAIVRLGYDDNALYVAYHCVEESLEDAITRHDARDTAVWNDDCADFVVLPAGTGKDGFLHYIVNADGVIYDAKGRGAGSSLWNSKIKIATGREPASEAWVLEMAIPWTDFDKRPGPGELWRAQFGRADPFGTGGSVPLTRYSAWAPSAAGFNNADYLGVLLFE